MRLLKTEYWQDWWEMKAKSDLTKDALDSSVSHFRVILQHNTWCETTKNHTMKPDDFTWPLQADITKTTDKREGIFLCWIWVIAFVDSAAIKDCREDSRQGVERWRRNGERKRKRQWQRNIWSRKKYHDSVGCNNILLVLFQSSQCLQSCQDGCRLYPLKWWGKRSAKHHVHGVYYAEARWECLLYLPGMR